MQHPAKGRQKARSYIKADLLDCPNRIACLLPYPSCPATNKKQTSATERVAGRRYDFGNLRISSTRSQKRTRDRTSDGRGTLPLRAHKHPARLWDSIVATRTVLRGASLARGRDLNAFASRAQELRFKMKAWPLSLSDPSSSLVLPGRPRLIAVVAPCLSPAPQPVVSRCAMEARAQGSHRPALSRARAQVRAVLTPDIPPSQTRPKGTHHELLAYPPDLDALEVVEQRRVLAGSHRERRPCMSTGNFPSPQRRRARTAEASSRTPIRGGCLLHPTPLSQDGCTINFDFAAQESLQPSRLKRLYHRILSSYRDL